MLTPSSERTNGDASKHARKRQTGKPTNQLITDRPFLASSARVASPLWADPSTSDVLAYAEAVYSDIGRYIESCETNESDYLHPVDTYLLTYVVIHDLW